MIGPWRIRIDDSGFQPVLEAATDETVIDMHPLAVIFRIHPAVASGRIGSKRRKGVDRRADPRRTAVKSVDGSGEGAVFRRFRLHVEIAHDDVILRQRQLWKPEFAAPAQRCALLNEGIDALAEMAKLRKAFVDRDMIEMDGIDADSAAGGRNNGFRSSTLQVYLVDRTAARQKQRARRQDRPARQ